MPHLPLMQWDYRDQLQATSSRWSTMAARRRTTYYVYDAAGQRVRKVTERRLRGANADAQEGAHLPRRLRDLSRVRERWRHDNAGARDAAHHGRPAAHRPGGDDGHRATTPAPEQLIRYQFGNHLGSASLELDDQAQIISYEEYYPYGSTSYQAVRSQTETPKRYRYTGMERDEESGLNYHGARYYAAWLGRWAELRSGRDGGWLQPLRILPKQSCPPARHGRFGLRG